MCEESGYLEAAILRETMWKDSLFCLGNGRLCCCCSVASVVSNSVWPHRWQPTRLPHPWDSPGKNTGVGCHFLLQSRKVKSESQVTQLCPTLRDPMDYSLPGSSIHGIFQERVLEWVAIAFSVDYAMRLTFSLSVVYLTQVCCRNFTSH